MIPASAQHHGAGLSTIVHSNAMQPRQGLSAGSRRCCRVWYFVRILVLYKGSMLRGPRREMLRCRRLSVTCIASIALILQTNNTKALGVSRSGTGPCDNLSMTLIYMARDSNHTQIVCTKWSMAFRPSWSESWLH
jgi:hypothetical protein